MPPEVSFFVDEPPDFELVDGLFVVSLVVDGKCHKRVMRPSTFARAVWRAEQALAAFRSGSNVVKFGAKVPDEDIAAAH
jgi:hypothetical protein